MLAWMRVRQQHIITVVIDATYDITFARLDTKHGYSISRSTRIVELADEDHGFLWRLNTYWSYEERDGGLYLQIEAVSLTRAIPAGLGWMLRPFVESIPRESLEFTLRSVCNALQQLKGHNNEQKRADLQAGASRESGADRINREARFALDGQPRASVAQFRPANGARTCRADRSRSLFTLYRATTVSLYCS